MFDPFIVFPSGFYNNIKNYTAYFPLKRSIIETPLDVSTLGL